MNESSMDEINLFLKFSIFLIEKSDRHCLFDMYWYENFGLGYLKVYVNWFKDRSYFWIDDWMSNLQVRVIKII